MSMESSSVCSLSSIKSRMTVGLLCEGFCGIRIVAAEERIISHNRINELAVAILGIPFHILVLMVAVFVNAHLPEHGKGFMQVIENTAEQCSARTLNGENDIIDFLGNNGIDTDNEKRCIGNLRQMDSVRCYGNRKKGKITC